MSSKSKDLPSPEHSTSTVPHQSVRQAAPPLTRMASLSSTLGRPRYISSHSEEWSAAPQDSEALSTLEQALVSLDYELVHELKRGHDKRVYRCRHKKSDVMVICKAGHRHVVKNEAQVLNDIQGKVYGCPSIIGTVELGASQLAMLVTDEGRDSLSGLVSVTGPLQPAEFIVVACQIVRTLGLLHECGYLHRDVKPENVAVCSATPCDLQDTTATRKLRCIEVSLLDFGLTNKIGDCAELAGVRAGTVPYMAPEATGRLLSPICFKTDIYSLGIAFYYLLTGSTPFLSGSIEEVLHKHLAIVPKNVCDLDHGIPTMIGKMIAKMLTKNPEDRYLSMHSLYCDLQRLAAPLPAQMFPEVLRGLSTSPCASMDEAMEQLRGMQFPVQLVPADSDFTLTRDIVGRNDVIEKISEECKEDCNGVSLIMVEGESGMGKSAVVGRATRIFSAPDDIIIRHKYIPGGARPYEAVLVGLATSMATMREEVRAEIRRAIEMVNLSSVFALYPDVEEIFTGHRKEGLLGSRKTEGPDDALSGESRIRSLSTAELRSMLASAVTRLVETLSSLKRSRLVLEIDDMQWVDQQTVDLIHHAAKVEIPLTVVATGRPEAMQQGALLKGLIEDVEVMSQTKSVLNSRRRCKAVVIKLGKMTIGGVSELVSNCFHGLLQKSSQLASLLLAECHGNPFYIRQMLRALRNKVIVRFDFAQGEFVWADRIARVGELTDITGMLLGQLQSHSHDVRYLLATLAVAAKPLPLWIISRMMNREVVKIKSAVMFASQQHLVAVEASNATGSTMYDGVTVGFVHDKTYEVASIIASETLLEVEKTAMIERLLVCCQTDGLRRHGLSDGQVQWQIQYKEGFKESDYNVDLLSRYSLVIMNHINEVHSFYESRDQMLFWAGANMYIASHHIAQGAYRQARLFAYHGAFFIIEALGKKVAAIEVLKDARDEDSDAEVQMSGIYGDAQLCVMREFVTKSLTEGIVCDEDCHDLFFALVYFIYESEFLCQNLDQANKCFDLCLKLSSTDKDTVRCYRCQMGLLAYTGSFVESLEMGSRCLKEVFDFEIALNPSPDDMMKVVRQVEDLLSVCDPDDYTEYFHNAARCTSWEEETICSILIDFIPMAYLSKNPALYTTSCGTVTARALTNGVNPASPDGLSVFGFAWAGFFQHYRCGALLAQAAVGLADAFDIIQSKMRTYMHMGMVGQWTHTPQKTLAYLDKALEMTLICANVNYSSYSMTFWSWCAFSTGEPLYVMGTHVRDFLVAVTDINAVEMIDCIRAVRIAESLLVSGEYPGENIDAELWISEDANPLAMISHHVYLGIAMYVIDRPQESFDHFKEITEELLTMNQGMIPFYDYFAWAPLVLASRIATLKERNGVIVDEDANHEVSCHRKTIEDCVDKLGHLAEVAPHLYEAKLKLARGQLLLLDGNVDGAIKALDEAANSAKANSLPHIAAVSLSLLIRALDQAGLFSLLNLSKKAEIEYLRMWGAQHKVNLLSPGSARPSVDSGRLSKSILDLPRRPPHIASSVSNSSMNKYNSESIGHTAVETTSRTQTIHSSDNVDTNGRPIQSFDAKAVAEASQLISSEIDINRLLVQLTRIVSTFSGAQKVVLALPDNVIPLASAVDPHVVRTQLIVRLYSSGSVDSTSLLHPDVPLSEFEDIDCETVVSSVRKGRSQLGNPDHTGLDGEAGASVASVPLIVKSGLNGIIYVENKILRNAFTEKHVNMLTMLSAQISVVIENAKLYSELRDHSTALEERNNELISMNESYSRFVPTEFCNLLGIDNAVQVRLGDMNELQMSVFYLDIRDFTRISEQMSDASMVFSLLNEILSRLGPIIRRNGGFIDKYIGDCIMALFPKQTHATDAVRAAVDIIRELVDYNKQRASSRLIPVHVGIGINSGSVVMGTIGETMRMDSTVISDTVNTASRLEGQSKVFGAEILISGETLTLLDPQFRETLQHRHIGLVSVKGKQIPIDVYEIVISHSGKMAYQFEFEKAIIFTVQKLYEDALKMFESLSKLYPDDEAITWYKRECAVKISFQQSARYCRGNIIIRKHPESLERDCMSVLYAKAGKWEYDIFSLVDKVGNNPLYFVSLYALEKCGLPEKFGLPPLKLRNFLTVINDGYTSRNSYHNSTHGADVVQAVSFFLDAFGLDSLLDPIEQLALIIASTIHDFRHPAVTNAFLRTTESELLAVATETGEQPGSVLESYHLCEGFHVLEHDQCAFLSHLPQETQVRVRSLITEIVLSTDLANHKTVLGEFTKAFDSGLPLDKLDRVLLMKMIMKVADVSNPARPRDIYHRWVMLVMQEFWTQGDVEQLYNLPISPFMQRSNKQVADCQIGFVTFIGLPQVEALCEYLRSRNGPAADQLISNTRQNLEYFQNVKAAHT